MSMQKRPTLKLNFSKEERPEPSRDSGRLPNDRLAGEDLARGYTLPGEAAAPQGCGCGEAGPPRRGFLARNNPYARG